MTTVVECEKGFEEWEGRQMWPQKVGDARRFIWTLYGRYMGVEWIWYEAVSGRLCDGWGKAPAD